MLFPEIHKLVITLDQIRLNDFTVIITVNIYFTYKGIRDIGGRHI